MNPIVFAIVVVVVLGLAGGVILVLASKFMAVYEDPRIAQVAECLAGANCGGRGPTPPGRRRPGLLQVRTGRR